MGKTLAVVLSGFFVGFFMVLLMPAVLVLWLIWRDHERRVLLSAAKPDSVLCDGGEEWINEVEARLTE